ncbi:MAG: class I SAM-dependent methyltransferase [Anaerolineae bacterium]|nr:class I SAM-dependent methyltransferase [Anaerolineae bacterium]
MNRPPAHRPSPRRPVGLPTRGKTALNRLRQVDVYVALAHPGALSSPAPLVVDLGFGAFPWTTLEMHARWMALNPALRVIGLEIDPERVAAAMPYADPPRVRFVVGGFNVIDALGGERARLIRAYNVLRQYDESAVEGALAAMAEALEPDGLLVEGTSTPSGRLVAFDVYRRIDGGGLAHEALVFGTNFRAHAAPVDFQAILPKRLIHHMRDPGPADFFAAWQHAQAMARGAARGRRAEWVAAARLLATAYPVDVRERITRRGYLAVRAPLR